MASVPVDPRFLARLPVEMMDPSKIGFSASHQLYCLKNSSTYSQFRGNRFLASRRRQNCTTVGQRETLFQGEDTVQTDSRLALSASVASAPSSTWLAARDSRRARWRLMFLASALCLQLISGLSVFHDGPDGVLDHLALSDLSSRFLIPLSLCLRLPLLSLALEASLTDAADHIPERFVVYLRDGFSVLITVAMASLEGPSSLEGSAWTKSTALTATSTTPSTTGPHSRSPRSPAEAASIRWCSQCSRRSRTCLPP